MSEVVHVGIDVAMETLAITILFADDSTQQFELSNDRKGFRDILKRLAALGAEAHVCMEATSTYHWKLSEALYGSPALTVYVANAKRAKDFIRSLATRGKTDKMDSLGLAYYVRSMPLLPWQPVRPRVKDLRDFARRSHQVTKDRTANRNRLHAMKRGGASSELLREYKLAIDANNAELERLIRRMLEFINGDPQLLACYRQLRTVKGIGKKSGILLLAEISYFPEGLSKKQWLAMAGMDPQPFESGTSIKHRSRPSKKGNSRLRLILFMPALVAVRWCEEVKGYYDRKCAEGRPKMSAIFIVMRKLLQAIWGMFHTQTNWNPKLFDGSAA